MYFNYLLRSFIFAFILNACGSGTNSSNTNNDITNNSNITKPTNIISMNTNNKDNNKTIDIPLFKEFNVGFGASGSFHFMGNDGKVIWLPSSDLILNNNIESNSQYQTIKKFDIAQFNTLQQHLKNTKFVGYWFTKGWNENWFSIKELQALIDKGYIPVFNYWYFADALGGSLPTQENITAYHFDNAKFASFLAKLKGTFIVIMEPEFNKYVVTKSKDNQHKFASIISDAIDIIKEKNSKALFSLCMSDKGRRDVSSIDPKCGYENCALGDVNEWTVPEVVYNDLLAKLDFISFQEMIGQFNRDPSKYTSWSNPIPLASTDSGQGIKYLAKRISNFAKFLSDKYKKPVFLPYIGIATASWQDNNNDNKIQDSELDLAGWETQASGVYTDLMKIKNELLANKLFGFLAMSLFDDPQNDINGYQYFMNNEYHLGIVKTSAKDATDKYLFGDIVFKGNILETLFPKKKI